MNGVYRRADVDCGRLRIGWWLVLLLFFALAACRPGPSQLPGGGQANPAAASRTSRATLPPPQLATPTGELVSPHPVATVSRPTPAANPPTQTPIPTVTPLTDRVVLGYSTLNRPIYGWRTGRGPLKVVVVGGETAGEELATFFQDQPSRVPDNLTLWFMPSPNPDNPGQSTNAQGVDLLRNADTILDSCSDNDWRAGNSPPPGGTYPFSEIESQLWRSFLADAWLVIWHDTGLQAGGCGLDLPSQQLAAVLATATGLTMTSQALPPGHPVDYLAGRGTAAATMPLTANGRDQTAAGIEAVLNQVNAIMGGGASGEAPVYWLDAANSGIWRFPDSSFPHPLALAMTTEQLFMIDSGRVLQFDLDQPAPPRPLLIAGDENDGARVLEPLDLALDGQGLLVLERAGDIYRFNLATQQWQLERYDRPVDTTSAHYYVALANTTGGGTRQLLETDYHLAILFAPGGSDFTWRLPEGHQVDVSSAGPWTYVLASELAAPLGRLSRFYSEAGRLDDRFAPQLGLHQPRQVEATETAVVVLDQAGRRLVAFDPESGQVQAIYRLANGQAASAFALDPAGQPLLVAPDALYWWGRPEQQATVAGSGLTIGATVHQAEHLETLRGLLMPIGGSDLTPRDNQLPGAPRHYRLGIHEGLDLYWTTGTAVRATAAGTVIRADWDYVNPTQAQFDAWWSITQSLGYTSPEGQEFYRGRQVWLAHDNGLASRYVHLSGIGPGIVEGLTVAAGQVVGYVGNSGSPVSQESKTTDAHLHFELWLGDYYLGQYLRPVEIWEWLTVLLRQ